MDKHQITIELTDYVHQRMLRIMDSYRCGKSTDRSLGIDTMHALCQATYKAYLGENDGPDPQMSLFGAGA